MLKLSNITKDYKVADTVVHALKGVSLNFRKSEFVSILGPSGCGKTTLLNIIGGMDKYTSGELTIGGVGTKDFKDADWDVYRNHRIGFIFQSYNLIPHQTVLGNVELALTIAGMSKAERVEKAKKALDRVGLEGQYYKKPNQLSGGQCQRVAIARALVNEPEILLADEPTGALDTTTSVQIMDLIKEIANEKLVIMVTHNPELAQKYSTRIIRLLDGEVENDSMPFSEEEEREEVATIRAQAEKEEAEYLQSVQERGGNVKKAKKKRKERAKMSIFTAFMLSARNLISKRARTIMVGIAGSIGIVGIALVLAFSAGIKAYVASMQDDMLSGNPIAITESTYDIEALTGMMSTNQKTEIIKKPNKVSVDSMVEYFIKMGDKADSLLIKNDINQNYIDYVKAMPSEYYSAMKLGYGIDVHHNIFTTLREQGKTEDSEISITALTALYTEILSKSSFADYAQYVSMFIPEMTQAPDDAEYISSQYTVYGKIATEKDEIMLVINKEDQMSDLLLARLGYYTQDEFMNIVYKADDEIRIEKGEITDYENFNPDIYKQYFDYDELLAKELYWYPNSQVFTEKTASGMGVPYDYNFRADEAWKTNANAVKLKVVGVLKPNESVMFGSLKSGVYYTKALTDHILAVNGAETDGLVDYYKDMDTSSLDAMMMAMRSSISYVLDYTFDTPQVANQTLSLSGNATMLSMLMGPSSSVTADDIKEAIVRTLGANSLANEVNIYPISFESKDLVTEYLDKWNGEDDIEVNGVTLSAADRQDVKYTDTLSLIINLINTMIDIVSYALIAFTSVSLVVSTVMIGIITYVSVVERIKEIGVIRSLGGRKKDVSRLFTAETVIIGLLAGIIGIGATYGISAIVNAILFPLIGIANIAALPILQALLLIALSVGLTLISGVFPARSAAKKDPVVALRTE
ncbi:MAG: ABC transporter ATP-binding protein/permease [Clostridia bacterium]|nr:ABC transporter ATP-binding protein/permease [Clostridia bacterium]